MGRTLILYSLGICAALSGIAWAASYRNNLDIMQAVWPVSRVAAWSHQFRCDQWWLMRWALNPKSQILAVSSKGRLTLMFAAETNPGSAANAAAILSNMNLQDAIEIMSLPSGTKSRNIAPDLDFFPIQPSEGALQVPVKGGEWFGFGFEELLHDSGLVPSDLFGGQLPQSFRVFALFFPLWALFLMLALWPGTVLMRRGIRHFRAFSNGCCGGCGYDLTGLMSARCPECGRAVPSRRDDIDVSEPVNVQKDPAPAPANSNQSTDCMSDSTSPD